MSITPDELAYWQSEYPSLTEEEILELLEAVELDRGKQ